MNQKGIGPVNLFKTKIDSQNPLHRICASDSSRFKSGLGRPPPPPAAGLCLIWILMSPLPKSCVKCFGRQFSFNQIYRASPSLVNSYNPLEKYLDSLSFARNWYLCMFVWWHLTHINQIVINDWSRLKTSKSNALKYYLEYIVSLYVSVLEAGCPLPLRPASAWFESWWVICPNPV